MTGSFLMLSMALAIVLFFVRYRAKITENENKIKTLENKTQIELISKTIEAEEKQKEMIANNLHDGLSSMLNALRVALADEKKSTLAEIEEKEHRVQMLDHCIAEVTATCYDLMPPTIKDYGLKKAIEFYMKTLGKAKGIKCTVNSSSGEKCNSLDTTIQINVFRASQEVINNAIKHSGCTLFDFDIKEENDSIQFIFTHDGLGIDNKDVESLTGNGLGLNSLRTRVLVLKGRIRFYKEPTSQIILEIPVR